MENQSPTPEKLSDIEKRISDKEKIKASIKDNLNYIYVALVLIANAVLSLLKVEDGSVGLNYPTDILGWSMWVIQIISVVVCGMLILTAFRRQGIKIGHKVISKIYNEYLELITIEKDFTPRSKNQYMKQQFNKDLIVKVLFFIVVNVFVVSVIIDANWNNLLALFINIIFAVGFGLKALLDAEEFVVQELVIWYKKEIKRLKEIEKCQNGTTTESEILN